MIRVSITGPESSGKSDLAIALAEHFGTSYAREYARIYLAGKDKPYQFEDIDTICKGQLEEEKKAMARGDRVVFFDTDFLVLKIWSEYRFGKVSPVVASAYEEVQYDHFLLCKPDIPWSPDPLRESPSQEERNELFDLYRSELHALERPYTVISGKGQSRVNSAISVVQELLDKTAGIK
jgi:NadR type nicotinamide-nucleotide adenylyltransferase